MSTTRIHRDFVFKLVDFLLVQFTGQLFRARNMTRLVSTYKPSTLILEVIVNFTHTIKLTTSMFNFMAKANWQTSKNNPLVHTTRTPIICFFSNSCFPNKKCLTRIAGIFPCHVLSSYSELIKLEVPLAPLALLHSVSLLILPSHKL